MFNCLRMVQPGSFLLSIHAKPGAKTSGFVGPLLPSEAAVEVRIAAPPVEGAANEELVSFVEESLDSACRRGTWDTQDAGGSGDASNSDSTAYSKPKSNAKGGSKKGDGGGGGKQQRQAPLPNRVRVSFHSGMTSRSKVLALELPCASVDKAWALLLAASAE